MATQTPRPITNGLTFTPKDIEEDCMYRVAEIVNEITFKLGCPGNGFAVMQEVAASVYKAAGIYN